jgi:chromosome segregation ATPase
MEAIEKTVSSLESSFRRSGRLLQSCQEDARQEIWGNWTAMKGALEDGNTETEHVISEWASFKSSLENHSTTDVSLRPQIQWLTKQVSSIITDLETAESRAMNAVTCTMALENKVNDVRQTVEKMHMQIDQICERNSHLAKATEERLKLTRRRISEAKEDMDRKSKQITTKTSEVSSLRRKVSEYETTLSDKERDLRQAVEYKRKKKKQAGAGVVRIPQCLFYESCTSNACFKALGAAGVILAPFTLGASLGLTAVGAGVAMYDIVFFFRKALTFPSDGAVDYDKTKDQISSIRSNITSVNRNKAEAETTVTRLTNEKNSLQSRISKLSADINAQTAAKNAQEKDLAKGTKLKSEIASLNTQNSNVTSQIRDLVIELQTLKQGLEKCSTILHEGTNTLKASATGFDTPFSARTIQAKRCAREMAAMSKVVASLELIHQRMPLLMSSTPAGFLEYHPTTKGTVRVATLSSIPAVKTRQNSDIPGRFPGSEFYL